MFGYLGHWQYNQTFEGNGHVVGSNRVFVFGMGTLTENLIRNERMIFDIDDVSVTKPNFVIPNSLGITSISNDGREYFPINNAPLLSSMIGIVQGATITAATSVPINNSYIGWAYNSNAALSPATRKYQVIINRPDIINFLNFRVINGNATSSTVNTISTAETFDLSIFPNLKSFNISNGYYANTITFTNFNTVLESFYINSNTTILTTINGKLPASVKYIQIGANVTNIDDLVEDAVNCEALTFGQPAGGYNGLVNPTTTLSGVLDVSHMTNMKIFTLPINSSLTSIVLPTGGTEWEWFHLQNMAVAARAGFNTAILEDVLLSPTLKIFYFFSNGLTWNINLTNSHLSSNLAAFNTAINTISGNITFSNNTPSLREFRTSQTSTRTGSQLNSHPIVDITGLTGARIIDMSGSNVEDLELPTNTVITELVLLDNKLDIVTNPNLVSQINNMTSLLTLRLSVDTGSALLASHVGQTSTNGLGADVDLSNLTALQILHIGNCKLTGDLTVSNTNTLTVLNVAFNTGLDSIINLNSHTALQRFIAHGCTSLTNNLGNTFTALREIRADNTQIETIDLSGKTTTSGGFSILIRNNTALTSITFPTAQNRCTISTASGNLMEVSGCVSLSSLTNVSNLNWAVTGATINRFYFNNNDLDIIFPFGTDNFIPSDIRIQDNTMSTSNVDGTIDSLYSNRTKWNVYSSAKSLNIAGSNSAASGTYQAPAGFVLGSNDGTPASAKEQIYVLVENYNWTITYN